MRQTLVLNLVVLGFFVLLFGSIYRKRQLPQLRLWITAYSAALVHFAVLLIRPPSPMFARWVESISLTALLLCGVCFLVSHPALDGPRMRRPVAYTLGLGAVLLGVVFSVQLVSHWAFVATDLLIQLAGASFLVWCNRRRPLLTWIGVMALAACALWSAELGWRGNDGAASVLLLEVYGFCGAVFADGFFRRSAGSLTAIAGLFAWAAVFPAGMLLDAAAPRLVVDPEIWNVPKVVVAFGLIVLLFEDELALAKRDREQYRHLFDNNPTPMWVFHKDTGQLLEANTAAVRTFGWRHVDLSALTVKDLLLPEEREGAELLELNRKLGSGKEGDFPMAALEGEVRATTSRFQTRRGEEVMVEATLQRTEFLGEEARLLMAKDITAQVRAHEQLVYLANHDPLTGLPNRLLLQDRLQAALASAIRHGTRAAVLCLDLDRFKQINDTYGHAAGDSCLREVAGRLTARLRAVDTAARTGGEEFMVVLQEVRTLADAAVVAEQLLACLRPPHLFDGISIQLSASIGIALFPDHGTEVAELWHNADAAMYHAKQSGGNRHSLYSLVS